MKLKVDIKIFLFLILFYFTKQIKIFGYSMIFCILHEFGHLLIGLLLKFKVERVSLMPYGISVKFKLFPKDYNLKIYNSNMLELKKIIVSIAGPITNLFLIFLFMNINVKDQNIIIYSNILIFIFNLLPIYPLDGGRIIRGILKIIKGLKKADKELNLISNITIIIITVVSGFAIYILKNISILIILLYLWYLVIKENKKYVLREKYYSIIEP